MRLPLIVAVPAANSFTVVERAVMFPVTSKFPFIATLPFCSIVKAPARILIEPVPIGWIYKVSVSLTLILLSVSVRLLFIL